MKALILLVLCACRLPGQWVSFGLKGGMPLSDVVDKESWNDPASGRVLLGPMFELRLPLRLGVEFDILYRSLKYRTRLAGNGGTVETTGQAWQFPLLAKYRFRGGLVSPYLGAGVSFQRLTDLREVGSLVQGRLSGRSAKGPVIAAGIEGRFLFLRLSPEVRYTHRPNREIVNSPAGRSPLGVSQFDFLVGIGL